MYKNSKWSKEIISLQKEDGLWGYFHTLSEPKKYPITTEQALRRLQILGYTIEDECIQKSVAYMHACLEGKKEMPDRREKIHDWDIFTQLMLATWIRRFTKEDALANEAAKTWADIISNAFQSGVYSHDDYKAAYKEAFSLKTKGGRLLDFANFYQVSLITDCLSEQMEEAVFDYILNHETGIYYIYSEPICILPEVFESKKASRYIGAVELLSEYRHNLTKFEFVKEWLMKQKGPMDRWDLGSSVKDFIYFPLSDSWNKDARSKDCTFRIEKLINKLTLPDKKGK